MIDERLGLPSGSDPAFGKCPGKRRLLATLNGTIVEQPDEETLTGTKIHEAFKTENTLMLSAEETETFNKGVEFCNRLVSEWCPPSECFTEGEREIRLWMHHPDTLDPVCSGQLDRHFICGKNAIIVDLKSGWGTYVPRTNVSMQLRVYAVLLWIEHPELERIRVAFAKPMSYRGGTNDFTDYTVNDLRMSEQAIRFFLWESAQEDAERRPGVWCRYCPGKSHCPEAGAMSLLPSAITKTPLKLKRGQEVSVEHLGPEDLLRIHKASVVIKKILDAVSNRLKGFTDEQLAPLGLMHGKAREIMRWPNPQALYEYLTNTEGWLPEDAWQAFDVAWGKLVAVTMKQKGLGEEAAKAILKDDLHELFQIGEGERGLKALKQ